MIDFNYTAPELLPLRIQEVLDAPNEPHRIGGVVYVPEGGGEGDGLPSVEWGRIVTGLIAAHYDNDEERFRERAVKAAKMYDERGKYEVAEYITAQYCLSTAFVPM